MTTVIVDAEKFGADAIELSADSFHHLFRVRRLRVNDALRVVDGEGRARLGEVSTIERHSARLSLGNALPSNEPDLALELLVAAPRPQRASWLVEKATELGVVAVRFLQSKRSPRTYGASTLNRLKRSARAAVEQCDRSLVPEVSAMHEWEAVPQLIRALDCCWVLDPAAAGQGLTRPTEARSVGLLVGPEGGWDETELRLFESLSCQASRLGPRILRVETAALAGASALLVTSSVDTV